MSSMSRRILFVIFSPISRPHATAASPPAINGLRPFALSPALLANIAPVHIEWSGQVRSIPFKKTGKAVVPYLDKPEMDALLAAPDCRTTQGRRERALLLFLYNSGARATEAAQLKIADLDIRAACVRISGKEESSAFALCGRLPSPKSPSSSPDGRPPNTSF